jgi:hypothetical protein
MKEVGEAIVKTFGDVTVGQLCEPLRKLQGERMNPDDDVL